MLPLSWSRIDTYNRCPYRFYLRYIKGEKEPESNLMKIGSFVHEILEASVKGRDISDILATVPSEIFEEVHIRSNIGRRIISGYNIRATELKWGLDKDLNPIGFDDPECFLRGIIDAVVEEAGGLVVVDYKTGWSTPDPRQIFLYALPLYRAGKNVKSARFVLCATGKTPEWDITNEEMDTALKRVQETWEKIQTSQKNDDWPKKASACSYCPFSCVSDGESEGDKIWNALQLKAQANEIFALAREKVKFTEDPIYIPASKEWYGPKRVSKWKVAGKKEDKISNFIVVAKWLLYNNPEALSISKLDDLVDDLPDEIKEYLETYETVSCEFDTSKEGFYARRTEET